MNIKTEITKLHYDKNIASHPRPTGEGRGEGASKIVLFNLLKLCSIFYGIGANALDEKAVGKIFIAKGRPSDNPLIVHLADKNKIEDIAQNITEVERKLIDAFMPGPFTLILKL